MKRSLAIIGGGSASLMMAAHLGTHLFDVCIYEKNKSLGRKFLVAGDGGFNLTHSESINSFIERYSPASFLKQALLDFTNEDLVKWLTNIGIPTYIGSSKRIFPEKGIKPIEVLNKIMQVLEEKNVKFKYEHEWTGWGDDGQIIFNSNIAIKADHIVFSLGGGSWKVTGSDGRWLDLFAKKGIDIIPFKSSNCAFQVKWNSDFIKTNGGEALKNINITSGIKTTKGEVVITEFGLEGNAIYALSEQIQDDLKLKNESLILIDLKPTLSEQTILEKLRKLPKNTNTTEFLRKELKLNKAKIGILKTVLSKNEFLDPKVLSRKIKNLPLVISRPAPIDEAISTMGGIDLKEVNEHFELKKIKKNYCIGEMLNWNAPTGGYLLQACFSMGVAVARHLNKQATTSPL